MTDNLPLALPADIYATIKEPFEGDLLERKPLAERLTGYVDRLCSGAVLAIDAPWGEGKSWFVWHWSAQLHRGGYRVGLIDAFQHDYVEDPFMLLAGEVLQLCAADKGMVQKIRDRAGSVMGALLPVLVKSAINVAGRALGASDLADEFSDAVKDAAKSGTEKGADVAKAWVEKKLATHEADKRSLRAFREALTEFVQAQSKPVVIVIDELDRCRPEFAVRLVERIKHFFDVPNLVFVLVMNRGQLEKAIRGVYGEQTDAAAYLGKFLNLSLRLPKNRSLDVSGSAHPARVFAYATLKRYGYEDKMDRYNGLLAACAVALDLSLRDVERVCALLFLAESTWYGLVVFLAALKIKHPDIFNGLRNADAEGSQACLALLAGVRARLEDPEDTTTEATYFRALIAVFDRDAPAEERNWAQSNVQLLFARNERLREPRVMIARVMAKLDLDVE